MSYTDKVISLRAELKEQLRDKVLMTSEQLEAKDKEFGDDRVLEEYFYSLPQAIYTDRHEYHNFAYLIELRGTTFIAYDNFNGNTVEIDMDWIPLDALAEFLDLQPIE